ncbi:type II toxin-antitoxin system RelE/ParE family toxin [Geothrix paludis]|uniref:type II toxin-antitoxin system RelE/ParE family toxin n=1 Tax=Geothrix paludis TaxID=2922722 RepID=UPI0024349F39|nr:type II toxin-antitoxin system RelE/ParE family toxin [Geothrix paludis]
MATLSIRFAPRAHRQLNEILQFIAMDNPDATSKIAAHVEKLLEHLREHPEMGKVVFKGLPHREVTAYPCRVIYRRAGSTIWVVTVLRVEQLLRLEMLIDN